MSLADELEGIDRPKVRTGFGAEVMGLPRAIAEILAAGAQGPVGQMRTLGGTFVEDIAKARGGDPEAKNRVGSRQLAASLETMLIPGSGAATSLPEIIGQRVGLGAISGSVGSGAAAVAGGEPVLPAAGKGAVFGAISNPLLGAVGDKALRFAARGVGRGQTAVAAPALEAATPSTALERVTEVIEKSPRLLGKQRAIRRLETGQKLGRAVAAEQAAGGGMRGFLRSQRELAGPLTKVDFESLVPKVAQQDMDELFNVVTQHPGLLEFEKRHAKEGLVKLFGAAGARLPQRSEIALLDEVFGSRFTKALLDKRSTLGQFAGAGLAVANVPRSLMASYDLSAPFRQGALMVGRPREFIPAFKSMFKYFGDEKAAEAAAENIATRSTYKLMRQAGLALTDPTSGLLTRGEERFMGAGIAESHPIVGPGVKASNRAYTGFLNKLRADVFDDFLKNTRDLGVDDAEVTRDIARFINAATGRGSLGSLERAAAPLNTFFFSPRLWVGRFQTLNPLFYKGLHPAVRKQALKTVLSSAAMAGSVLGLAAAGGAVVGRDPRSADFGKIKIGNTRYDILAGVQQPVRLLSQLISGKVISSTTGKEIVLGEGYRGTTRKDIVERYLTNKEAPAISFATMMLSQKGPDGKPINVPKEIGSRFVPLMAQDLSDVLNEWGKARGIPMGVPGVFGVGTQTYGGKEQKSLADELEAIDSPKPRTKTPGLYSYPGRRVPQ